MSSWAKPTFDLLSHQLEDEEDPLTKGTQTYDVLLVGHSDLDIRLALMWDRPCRKVTTGFKEHICGSQVAESSSLGAR